MLTAVFPKIGGSRVAKAISAFLYSGWYTVGVVLLMVCSNLFALELPTYYLYALFCVLTALFADDLFPIIPMACTSYMTFSAENNPAADKRVTLFETAEGINQLIGIAAVIVLFLGTRVVYELIKRSRLPKWQKKSPALTWGFALLGVSYLLGGSFSPYYEWNTVLFGLVQIVSLCIFYFLFYYTVDWQSHGADEWAKLFVLVGVGVAVECVGMYLRPETFAKILNGTFSRNLLVTGWGIYNNVGAMITICMPATFYLACKRKNGWIYTLLGGALFATIVLSQSRGSILFGLVGFVAGAVITVIVSRGRERKRHFIALGALAVIAIVFAIILKDQLRELFEAMLNQGTGDNGRFNFYELGIKQFLEYPWFGNGFYQCKGYQLGYLPKGSFLPPRYHNTFVQLLASGGTVAMLAYVFHRLQTLKLFFEKPSLEKTLIAVCVLMLTLTSLTDCHFFNFGPGLLYSCLLVFAEKANCKREKFLK